MKFAKIHKINEPNDKNSENQNKQFGQIETFKLPSSNKICINFLTKNTTAL